MKPKSDVPSLFEEEGLELIEGLSPQEDEVLRFHNRTQSSQVPSTELARATKELLQLIPFVFQPQRSPSYISKPLEFALGNYSISVGASEGVPVVADLDILLFIIASANYGSRSKDSPVMKSYTTDIELDFNDYFRKKAISRGGNQIDQLKDALMRMSGVTVTIKGIEGGSGKRYYLRDVLLSLRNATLSQKSGRALVRLPGWLMSGVVRNQAFLLSVPDGLTIMGKSLYLFGKKALNDIGTPSFFYKKVSLSEWYEASHYKTDFRRVKYRVKKEVETADFRDYIVGLLDVGNESFLYYFIKKNLATKFNKYVKENPTSTLALEFPYITFSEASRQHFMVAQSKNPDDEE